MSVNEYTAYFAKAIADVSGKFDDGDQVSFFLRGMDPAFRAQVLSRGSPTKLADAVTLALQVEHALLQPAPHTGSVAVATPTPPHNPHSTPLDPNLLAQIVAAVLAQQAAAPGSVNALPSRAASKPQTQQQQPRTRTRDAPRDPTPDRDRSRDRWTPDGLIICNFCAAPGHKARDCPNRRSAQGMSPGQHPF